jgi:hypothetical protein
MKIGSQTIRVLVALFLVIGSAGTCSSQVKTVQMKIAGYLCGN